jgi:hypothetical protein
MLLECAGKCTWEGHWGMNGWIAPRGRGRAASGHLSDLNHVRLLEHQFIGLDYAQFSRLDERGCYALGTTTQYIAADPRVGEKKKKITTNETIMEEVEMEQGARQLKFLFERLIPDKNKKKTNERWAEVLQRKLRKQ